MPLFTQSSAVWAKSKLLRVNKKKKVRNTFFIILLFKVGMIICQAWHNKFAYTKIRRLKREVKYLNGYHRDDNNPHPVSEISISLQPQPYFAHAFYGRCF